MLNFYQSTLSAILHKFEDKIIILDGWPIKELELLVESSSPIAIPQSFTSQMIDGNFDYEWFAENFKIIASKKLELLFKVKSDGGKLLEEHLEYLEKFKR